MDQCGEEENRRTSPSSLGGWVRMGPRSEGDAGAWGGVQMAVTLGTRKRRDLV